MSRDLPASIEPLHLAKIGMTLTGSLPLVKMERIKESLCDSHGEVYIHWSFFQDDQRRSVIQGKIHTQLLLQCQRCLQPMTYQIDAPVALMIVSNGTEPDDLQIEYEMLELTDTSISLLTLVEDELILALPLVVMHEHCPNNKFVNASSEDLTYNPFHILTKLKQ